MTGKDAQAVKEQGGSPSNETNDNLPESPIDSNEKSFHRVQRDIRQFHEMIGVKQGETPAIRRAELRAELIREEADETIAAILEGDLVEAIDGMCDLLCVVYGTADEFGVNLAPYWSEVHRSNMAKKGGPVREDGKKLKPEGWAPPDIAGILEEEMAS